MMEFSAYYHPGLGWLVATVISSIVHALIYGVIFKALHYLTLVQAIVLLVVVLGGLAFWMNARARRRW
jgi:hypothetical protein